MMIITDSASDITKQETLEMNIRIVHLKTKFSFGDFFCKEMKKIFNIFLKN